MVVRSDRPILYSMYWALKMKNKFNNEMTQTEIPSFTHKGH